MTTTLTANEDYEIALPSIFGAGGDCSGQTQSEACASEAFAADRLVGRADDENALTYAVDREWLPLHLGMVRLTAAGFPRL